MIPPNGATSISISGVEIHIADGVATVDSSHVEILRSHGFTTEGPPDLTDVRSDLVRGMVTAARLASEMIKDSDLMAFSALPDELRSEFWSSFCDSVPKFVASKSSKADPVPGAGKTTVSDTGKTTPTK